MPRQTERPVKLADLKAQAAPTKEIGRAIESAKGALMIPIELERLAKARNLNIQGLNDAPDIIRAIQVAEGNHACYQSEIAHVCGIQNCLWREQGCVTRKMPE